MAKLKLKSNYRRNYNADMQAFETLKTSMKNVKKRIIHVREENKAKIVQATIVLKTVGVSFFVTFIAFLMVQVIWADAIATSIPVIETVSASQFWIQLLLMTGLFSGLGISVIVFIAYGAQKDITGELKIQARRMITSALWSALVAFLVLVSVSFIAVYAYDPGIFSELSIIGWFSVFFEVMADFVVYIYPSPTVFWLISIGIYFSVLTVLVFLRVPRSKRADGRARREQAEALRLKIQGQNSKKCKNRTKKNDHNVGVSIFIRS